MLVMDVWKLQILLRDLSLTDIVQKGVSNHLVCSTQLRITFGEIGRGFWAIYYHKSIWITQKIKSSKMTYLGYVSEKIALCYQDSLWQESQRCTLCLFALKIPMSSCWDCIASTVIMKIIISVIIIIIRSIVMLICEFGEKGINSWDTTGKRC